LSRPSRRWSRCRTLNLNHYLTNRSLSPIRSRFLSPILSHQSGCSSRSSLNLNLSRNHFQIRNRYLNQSLSHFRMNRSQSPNPIRFLSLNPSQSRSQNLNPSRSQNL
jgi:hypothetical protein